MASELEKERNKSNIEKKEKDAKNNDFINRCKKLAQPEKYAQAIEDAEKKVIDANSVLATKKRELEKLKEKRVKLEEQINSCN